MSNDLTTAFERVKRDIAEVLAQAARDRGVMAGQALRIQALESEVARLTRELARAARTKVRT